MISCHLCHDILLYFCRCFTIAYVCCPTLIFDIIVRCNVSSSCLIFCYHDNVLSSYMSLCFHVMSCHPFLLLYHRCWCFVILTVAFVFLTKKHKPTKIYESNYGFSDSLKGIRMQRLLWGLIEHIFVNIPFFSPYFIFLFLCVVPQNLPSHFSKDHPGLSGLLLSSSKFWITTFQENHPQGQNGQKHIEKSNLDF